MPPSSGGVTLLGKHLLGQQLTRFFEHVHGPCDHHQDLSSLLRQARADRPVLFWSTSNRESLSDAMKLRLRGYRVYRYWIGGDVMRMTKVRWPMRRTLIQGNRQLFQGHFTTSQWLTDELKSLGIASSPLPFSAGCCGEHWPLSPFPEPPYKVLYYSLAGNDDIYLPEVVEQAAQHNPMTTFLCVGNRDLKISGPNIVSLGIVSPPEMRSLYETSHCLLRFTSHDGFPRSIFEALVNGLDVVTNLPVPHSIHVSSKNQVAQAITSLANMRRERNIPARDWVLAGHTASSWTKTLVEGMGGSLCQRDLDMKANAAARWMLHSSPKVVLAGDLGIPVQSPASAGD